MLLNIFSNQNFCHLCELFLWMLGSFLVGYFFWRWWFRKKCENEVADLKKKYKKLEHELNTTVKASKVTAPGVEDPTITKSNFVDGVAKASSFSETTKTSSEADVAANSLTSVTDKKKKTTKAKKATTKSKTKKTTTSTKGTKDDLTKIEGIGPKIQGLLYDDKITTYNSLADTKVNSLKTILDNAGPRYRMHDPKTWPKQAKLAADGKWDKLKKWQDELKGGVKAGKKADDAVKDDLTKIEGIGPKIKGLLNDDGIWSFKQLSKASVKRLQKVLDNAGPRYRVHKPSTWPEQAKLASQDKWDELKQWQDQLKGGR